MNREELEKSLKIAKTERKRNKKTVRTWDETIGSIKQQLKDLPKLEVGKWYKGGQYLVCLVELNKTPYNSEVFGFSLNKWYEVDNFGMNGISKMTPATDKEVEEALIKEAKKRGFKKGVEYSNNGGTINQLKSSAFIYEYVSGVGMTLGTKDMWFYGDGKWAEIIEPKTVFLAGDYTSEQLKVYIKDLEK